MQLVDAKKYKAKVKKLYKIAFPKNERAPISFLFSKTKHKENKFYAALDNNEFVGLAYTIQKNKMLYIFYLAVAEEKRGKGFGSEILATIKNMYSDCTILLEIEDTALTDAENFEERIKRLKFYQKNGYSQTHIRLNEAGVDFELLGTAATVTQAEFLSLMKRYLGAFLFKIIYRKTKFE